MTVTIPEGVALNYGNLWNHVREHLAERYPYMGRDYLRLEQVRLVGGSKLLYISARARD
jgi:hypothetical protein